jgi:hypothetical protein
MPAQKNTNTGAGAGVSNAATAPDPETSLRVACMDGATFSVATSLAAPVREFKCTVGQVIGVSCRYTRSLT